MGKKTVSCWQDCRDGRKVEQVAKANGINVVQGRGSHRKLQAGQHSETFYPGEMSIGVARAVYKFFVRVGVAAIVILLFLGIALALMRPEILIALWSLVC